MNFEATYRSKWPEDLGIDTVESRTSYEQYGSERIVNRVFAFVANQSRELCEDYIGDVFRLIDFIEKAYALRICSHVTIRTNAPEAEKMLFHLEKPEGCEKVQYDEWHTAFNDVEKWLKIDELLKEALRFRVYSEMLPVFQRRNDWTVTHGDFCQRCERLGAEMGPNYGDYQLRVRGRFGFGFVPADKVLSRKRILFRKFEL